MDFNNVTETIDVDKYDAPDKAYVDMNDTVLRTIEKYKSHPNILRIRLLGKNKPEFKFKHFPPGSQEFDQLLENKNSTAGIPVQVLKRYADICLPLLTDLVNNDGHWPIELRSASITPAHKKMSATNKENYRPVSVFLPVS